MLFRSTGPELAPAEPIALADAQDIYRLDEDDVWRIEERRIVLSFESEAHRIK
jgi:1,2-phenylacetyl-CoA epoxidase PaaB subunit